MTAPVSQSGPVIPPARLPGAPYRVCFVCTGNICRSPMAEVVLRELAGGQGAAVERSGGPLEISSAGTGPWHVGEPMDPRARAALTRAGHTDHGHVARQIADGDLAELDLILALDRRHHTALREMDAGGVLAGRLYLLGSFAPGCRVADPAAAPEIADPFYGDDADFEACLRDVEAACHGLFQALGAAHGPGG